MIHKGKIMTFFFPYCQKQLRNYLFVNIYIYIYIASCEPNHSETLQETTPNQQLHKFFSEVRGLLIHFDVNFWLWLVIKTFDDDKNRYVTIPLKPLMMTKIVT